MIKKYEKLFNVAFLLAFLFVSLLVNFSHCEKKVHSSYFCPACHFQSSALATGQINFFMLPPLSTLGTLNSFEPFQYKHIFFIHPNSRSPPLI